MRWLIIMALLFSFEAVLGINQVMLVTDLNAPDAFSASVAGSIAGVPVLVTNNGEVNNNITSALNELNASEVIIIGGPRVIKGNVDSELESLGFNVTRLWGYERTGTAIEIAKYFWDNSSCMVLVQDTFKPAIDSSIQSEAVSKAVNNNCPLIPLTRNKVTSNVLELINELNTTSITYIGSGLDNGSASYLKDYNLTMITGNITLIRRQLIKRIKFKGLLIIAAPSWNHTVTIGATMNNQTLIRKVSDITELTPIISLIQENNVSPVRVVGEPVLGSEIISELEVNNINASLYTGNPSMIARRLVIKERNKFKKRFIRIVRNELIINQSRLVLSELKEDIQLLKNRGFNTTTLENKLASINESLSNYSKKSVIKEVNNLKTRIFVKLDRNEWIARLNNELSNNHTVKVLRRRK